MDTTKKGFSTRAFVALASVFSGLGLPVTGIVNHFYGLAPMTTARHAWMTAHNILSLVFVVFTVWHIILNRRALWNHALGSASRLPAIRREALCAAILVVGVLTLFVSHAFHAGHR